MCCILLLVSGSFFLPVSVVCCIYFHIRRITQSKMDTPFLSFWTAATVNRGCCRVENNSPSCPPGPLFQSQTDEDAGWTIYYTRCDTDLCNDGDGLGDNDDSSGGVLVVDGVPEGTYSRGERIFQGLGVSLSSFIALFSVRRIFRVATM